MRAGISYLKIILLKVPPGNICLEPRNKPKMLEIITSGEEIKKATITKIEFVSINSEWYQERKSDEFKKL